MRSLPSYIASLQPNILCFLWSSIYSTAHRAHLTSFCTSQVTMSKSFSASSVNYLMLLQPPTLVAAILLTLNRQSRTMQPPTLVAAIFLTLNHQSRTIAILHRSNHHPQNQMNTPSLKTTCQRKTIKTSRILNPHSETTKILQRINCQTQNQMTIRTLSLLRKDGWNRSGRKRTRMSGQGS